jgi:hypothetical protein
MRPVHNEELRAIGAQLLAGAAEYEPELQRLLTEPDGASLYDRNADLFDSLRAYAAMLPRVQVCWVEVLISRYELIEEFWMMRRSDAPRSRVTALHRKHLEALGTLCELCRQFYGPTASDDAAPRLH